MDASQGYYDYMLDLHRMRVKHVLAVVCALIAANLACSAKLDIWLTATSNSRTWPGTSNAPFYAGKEAAFTAILTTNLNCTFHYTAGTYQTLGYKFQLRKTANVGCKHFGAGMDKTIIQLVGAQPGANGVIFGSDADYLTDGFELHDMTLDCNAVHNAVYTNRSAACHAVNTAGNDLLLTGLKVIGFGTGGSNIECFPVNLTPLSPATGNQTNVRNAIVQNCIFTSAAPSNACGVSCCTVGAAPGWNMVNFVIRNCTVSNLDRSFVHPQAFYAPLVENCLVENCIAGWYSEPAYMDEAHRDWIVRSNTFRNVDFGIYLAYAPGNRIKSLTVEGNQFQLKCPPSAGFMSIGLQPPQGQGIDWLVLRNNTVSVGSCSDPTSAGWWLAGVTQAVVQSNRFTLASGKALVLDSSTVSARWFSGNIDATGSALLVTNCFLGSTSSQEAATLWPSVKPPQVKLRLLPGP